jgi:carbon-monoxide dehydrogenase medium subunit
MIHLEAFYRPNTIGEALRLMRRGPGEGRFVAGGTDLIVQGDRSLRFVVDLSRLGLRYIKTRNDGCAIGATTSMWDVEHSPAIQKLGSGILAKAAATSGSIQLRHMATIGGNLANASPAADTAPPLLALDAQAVIVGRSPRDRRRVPVSEFFLGVRKTVLKGGLLVEVFIPARRGGRVAWSFQKLGRLLSDISIVNAAVGIQLNRQERCTWARIALGAVAATPMRARQAEAMLEGKILDRALLERVCEKVKEEVQPITDVRSTAEYRREMSGVLVRQAVEECAERIGCKLK